MKAAIDACISISDEIYQSLQSEAEYKKQPKGEIISRPGKAMRKILFLERGMLRGYRLVEGQEYTHHFYFEQWFATDFHSYLTDSPSQLFLESITEIAYYEFDRAVFEELCHKYHVIERLGRIIAERAYLTMVERMIHFQTNDLKQRYQSLMTNNSQLLQKVPQKYLASYLGVAEQSLSRIKAAIVNS